MSLGCPLPPYIKEQGGGRPALVGAPGGGVLLLVGVGLPSFLLLLGGGKDREREKERGVPPPSPSPIRTRGGHQPATRVEGAPPVLVGAPGRPLTPIFCYMVCFDLKKNHKHALRTKHRRHEAEPWRKQSRAPTELFCQGNFPPGGGNHHHRHHQRSSHREGVNLHQHLHHTISCQNPSSSLASNLVSKPQIGTCRLLVVLITPCS